MTKVIDKATYSGEYYHIFNRGNRQQDIFLEDKDYLDYLNRIRQAKEKYKIATICYCLMPNHFHLLVRQDSDIMIAKFMASVHTGYAMYFNRKYNKVGHLFQGKYKQKHIDTDDYILGVSSYIHTNPYVGGLTDNLEDYQWSSYPDYVSKRKGTLCEKDIVLREMDLKKYKELTEEEAKDRLIIKRIEDKLKQQKNRIVK
ncbi:MAG: transposase [bacterium]